MTYRVYFNRWADAPLVWSVDHGTQATEVNVREVHFDGISGVTRSGPGDNQSSPTVWIEVHGRLQVHNDIATFHREAAWAPDKRAA
jgi:hypothetical protein